MNKEFRTYIDIIIDNIGVSGKKEKQIREDLYVALEEKYEATGEVNPYKLMGDPQEVANEFRENLEIQVNTRGNRKYGFEYTSKTKIFGIPLVHINARPFGVAKGIFSIGSVAIGLFSFGCISIGIFSFGAIVIGLLMAFGGMAFSCGISIGGTAIAYGISIGGMAIAKYIAVGDMQKADIAIGGVAHGIVAVFNQHGTGQYMFKMPANKDEVIMIIRKVHPDISKVFLELIRKFI